MTKRGVVAVGWGLALLAVAGAGLAWRSAVPRVAASPPPHIAPTGALVVGDSAGIAITAERIRSANPFRLERKPSAVHYDPWKLDAVVGTGSARPARPPVALVGLVGGPPWHVVLEGVPGREGGILLALGQESSGFRLVAVRGDTAVVAGVDTTWHLVARR
jgi:hypothetical protein